MTKRIDPRTIDRIRRDAGVARLLREETQRHPVPTHAPDGRALPQGDRCRRHVPADTGTP